MNRRNGLSLVEVLLSIAILGGSMVVISNMYFLAYRSAVRARLVNDANILCDTVMAELAAGVLPANSIAGQTFQDNPEWAYSVEIGSSMQPGLLVANVIVQQANPEVAVPVSVSIVRFLPDPDYEPEG